MSVEIIVMFCTIRIYCADKGADILFIFAITRYQHIRFRTILRTEVAAECIHESFRLVLRHLATIATNRTKERSILLLAIISSACI